MYVVSSLDILINLLNKRKREREFASKINIGIKINSRLGREKRSAKNSINWCALMRDSEKISKFKAGFEY